MEEMLENCKDITKKNAKWIWHAETDEDSYINFFADFILEAVNDVIVNISASDNYVLYINGMLVAFSQYPDYPHYKVYDRIDVSKFVKTGKNRLTVTAYHCGGNFFTTYKTTPGLYFCVECGCRVLTVSDKRIKCRKAKDYISGNKVRVSGQLGYTFSYDKSKYDGFVDESFSTEALACCVEVPDKPAGVFLRETQKTVIGELAEGRLIGQGFYVINGGKTAAEMQQLAYLYQKYEDFDGYYFLFDLGREEAGFLHFELTARSGTKISIGYGEHLADGRVNTFISNRNFAAEYMAAHGPQCFTESFLRFAGRYLQVFADDEITIEKIGLVPVTYPLSHKPAPTMLSELRQSIYKTAVHTLSLCLHEHYEDTPWREQAMYAMDSRNQILCGYYAFNNTEFARASLKLMAQDCLEDGLFAIAFPSAYYLRIPSFSLYYPVMIWEYIEHTGDLSLAAEVFEVMQRLIKTFTDRIENGLVPVFYGDKKFWNFYEWTEGMSGNLFQPDEKSTDLVLNCLLSYSLLCMGTIARLLKKEGGGYMETAKEINQSVNRIFYDESHGAYKTFIHKNHFSELANALAILCGAADEGRNKLIAQKLAQGGIKVKTSLSMMCFKYDAMLKTDKRKYAPLVLEDIDKTYGYMLKKGATSFWETLEGECGFGGAGSLCHGWSAMPVYYYNVLL